MRFLCHTELENSRELLTKRVNIRFMSSCDAPKDATFLNNCIHEIDFFTICAVLRSQLKLFVMCVPSNLVSSTTSMFTLLTLTLVENWWFVIEYHDLGFVSIKLQLLFVCPL